MKDWKDSILWQTEFGLERLNVPVPAGMSKSYN